MTKKATRRFRCPGCGLSKVVSQRQPDGRCIDCLNESARPQEWAPAAVALLSVEITRQPRKRGPVAEPRPLRDDLPTVKAGPVSHDDRKAWRKVAGLEPVVRQSDKVTPMFAASNVLDESVAIASVRMYQRSRDVRTEGMGSADRGVIPKGDPYAHLIEDEDDDGPILEAYDLEVTAPPRYARDETPATWELELEGLRNVGLCECAEHCGRPAEVGGLSRRCYMRRRRQSKQPQP